MAVAIEDSVIFCDIEKWVTEDKEVLLCSLRKYCLQPTGTEFVRGTGRNPPTALTPIHAEGAIMHCLT